jgi:DHA1 family multidrug resistance protein-like MFS transporter
VTPTRPARPDHAWLRTTYIVAATQAVVLLGFGLALPFIPLYLQELGLRDRGEIALWTGLISGAAGLPMALFAPIWGAVGDRYGRKTMLVRAIAGAAIVLFGISLVTDVRQLLVLRVIQGALTGTGAAAATLVATIAPRARTGFALSTVNTAMQTGNFVGPLVGGLAIAAIGFRSSFLVSAAIMAICTVVCWLWVHEPARTDPRPPIDRSRRALLGGVVRIFAPLAWPELRGIMIVQLATQAAYSSTLALLPLYVQDLARPAWLSTEILVGLALAAGAVSAAVATPFLGIQADRRGPRSVLLFGVGLTALGLLPHAFAIGPVLFLALRVLLGVALAAIGAATGVLTRTAARPGSEGRAFGAATSAQMLGWGVGPLIGSAIAAAFGLPALFAVGGAASAVLTAAIAARPRTGRQLAPRPG